MFKHISTCIVLIFVCNCLPAQSFMHSIGATISIMDARIHDSWGSSYSISTMQTHFSYFPRYNFTESDNTSVSIGLPLGVGVGFSDNGLSDYGVAFAFDIPAVVDYNFGYKSTPDNDSRVGGYLGAGFGYYRITISKSSYSDFTGVSYGPMVRAGFRFTTPHNRENGHGVTVGLFYKKGLEKEKFNTYGCNVYFDF